MSNDYGRTAQSYMYGSGRRNPLDPRAYYQPRYERYRYCRPYRHFDVRHQHRRHHYCGLTRPYYGYLGLGYYPRSGYFGLDYYYPSDGYYGLDYYPTRYHTYTTVYHRDPYWGSFDDDGASVTNNIYIGDEAEEVMSGQGGGVAYISAPQTSGVEPIIEVGPPLPTAGTTAEPSAEPGLPEPTLVDLGNAAFNDGAYDEAVRYYIGAVLTDDQDGIARLFYGLAEFALGDYDLAATGMRRALVVLPDLIERPIDLRSLYPDLGTFESHLNKLVRFVNEHPKGTNALFVLGYVYYASAQPELAAATMRSLTELDPTDELAAKVRDASVQVLSVDPSTE